MRLNETKKQRIMTIAQQLNITEFPFEIKDQSGNLIYFENATGYWSKREYDVDGSEIYFENSEGEVLKIKPNKHK